MELGFKADDAKQIVMQTMKGAVELLQASGLHPEAAIDLVTTPAWSNHQGTQRDGACRVHIKCY